MEWEEMTATLSETSIKQHIFPILIITNTIRKFKIFVCNGRVSATARSQFVIANIEVNESFSNLFRNFIMCIKLMAL